MGKPYAEATVTAAAHRRKLMALAVATAIALPQAVAVRAAEWQQSAGVSIGAISTDNVCLSAVDEESELIGTLTPDIRVTGEGRRASMDLLAALEFNTLADKDLGCNNSPLGGDKESPAPRLRFLGESILADNWLYFDATAYADQNRINPFGVGGDGNLDGAGNTNTTYQYALNPYLDRRWTNGAGMFLGYTFDEQFNSEDVLVDSRSHDVRLDVGLDPDRNVFSAGVSGRYNKLERDDSPTSPQFDSELSSAELRAAYRINSEWQLNGYIGQEWNDFVAATDEIEGDYWDFGIRWQPFSRVLVEAGVGDRFYGSAPRALIDYSHKRSGFRLRYDKTLTYDRDLRSTDQFAEDIDQLENETVDVINGDSLSPTSIPTTITSSPIVNERLVFSYRFTGRRTSLGMNLGYSEQSRLEDNRDDNFTTAAVTLRRALGVHLSSFISLGWEDREFGDRAEGQFGAESDTVSGALGFDWTLGDHLSARVRYDYRDRESDLEGDTYTENRLGLYLRYRF